MDGEGKQGKDSKCKEEEKAVHGGAVAGEEVERLEMANGKAEGE